MLLVNQNASTKLTFWKSTLSIVLNSYDLAGFKKQILANAPSHLTKAGLGPGLTSPALKRLKEAGLPSFARCSLVA
jgi:hypothetical protein